MKGSMRLGAVCVGLVACTLLLLPVQEAWALGGSNKGLSPGAYRDHPDPTLIGSGPTFFNVYMGIWPDPANWVLQNNIVGTFDSGPGPKIVKGSIESWAYQSTADNHILFLYQITMDPASESHGEGNLGKYPANCGVRDSGVFGNDTNAFNSNDVLRLTRDINGNPLAPYDIKWEFAFGVNNNKLLGGTTSSVFYIDTNWDSWALGGATFQNSQVSAFTNPNEQQFVLVPDPAGTTLDPIPEPMTMMAVMMGIGGLAGYVKKRRA